MKRDGKIGRFNKSLILYYMLITTTTTSTIKLILESMIIYGAIIFQISSY
jgi:hypothetical protein